MSDFSTETDKISEKGSIFSLVFGFGGVLVGIFGYIFGFGLDFSSILILIFGFGWIFFVIGLVSLIGRHYNPITESEKVSAKAQVNTFWPLTESELRSSEGPDDQNWSQNGQTEEILPQNLDETTPLRLDSKGGRAGRPKIDDLVGQRAQRAGK